MPLRAVGRHAQRRGSRSPSTRSGYADWLRRRGTARMSRQAASTEAVLRHVLRDRASRAAPRVIARTDGASYLQQRRRRAGPSASLGGCQVGLVYLCVYVDTIYLRAARRLTVAGAATSATGRAARGIPVAGVSVPSAVRCHSRPARAFLPRPAECARPIAPHCAHVRAAVRPPIAFRSDRRGSDHECYLWCDGGKQGNADRTPAKSCRARPVGSAAPHWAPSCVGAEPARVSC